MKLLLTLSLLISMPFGVAIAQNKSPELQALSQASVAKVMDIDAERWKALKLLQDDYLKVLTDLEKAALTKGSTTEQAAIAKIRETAAKTAPIHLAETIEALPEQPASAQKAFNNYLAATTATDTQFESRRLKHFDEYLRTLAAYEAKLPPDAPDRVEIPRMRTRIANMPKWIRATTKQSPSKPPSTGTAP